MTEPSTPNIAQHDPDDRDKPRPSRPFVPAEFEPPAPPRTSDFWLEPLGPQHNEADYAAWTTSLDHIRATPGFANRSWPQPMSLADNLADLQMHARHFDQRVGFTYTVRAVSDDDVVGCVYIYPDDNPEDDSDAQSAADAQVRSWVRKSRAQWDSELADVVAAWLAEGWPFRSVRYRWPSTASS